MPVNSLSSVDILHRLSAFEAALSSADTATRTLEDWCGTMITAKVLERRQLQVEAELAHELQIELTETVHFRRVALYADDVILSLADNFYVAQRLTRAMREALTNSSQPFGKVILSLGPQRHTLKMQRFWHGETPIPETLFGLDALVKSAENLPLARVTESYQRTLLCFARAR